MSYGTMRFFGTLERFFEDILIQEAWRRVRKIEKESR